MRPMLLAAILAAALPGLASAHSALSETVPAEGAVVAAPVTEIALTFKNPMRLTRVEVEGVDGPVELEIEEPMGTEFVLPADLPAGAYELRWIGLGSDGHPMKGDYLFEAE